MFFHEAKVAAQTAFAGLTMHGRRAAQLWLEEARATLPAGWLAKFGQLARPVLTLTQQEGALCGRLHAGSVTAEMSWPLPQVSIEVMVAWLNGHGISRDQVSLQVALEAELFLYRTMRVPRAALGSLPSIIAQDIVHRTPFEESEIWHAARPSREANATDIIEVEHWIIGRDRARQALETFRLRPEEVDALAVGGSAPLAVIALRQAELDHPASARRLVRFAAAAALALALVGAITIEWIASREMSRLDAAIAELRGQGSGGQGAAQLLTLRAAPGAVEVWEELSRLLPDHTYLSELRLADGGVAISGFSADAAHLIRLLDQSPLFTGAHLTGAITPDKAEHKERFSLAFHLRGMQRPGERPGTAVARSDP
jgi:general secretion pathway protein L